METGQKEGEGVVAEGLVEEVEWVKRGEAAEENVESITYHAFPSPTV